MNILIQPICHHNHQLHCPVTIDHTSWRFFLNIYSFIFLLENFSVAYSQLEMIWSEKWWWLRRLINESLIIINKNRNIVLIKTIGCFDCNTHTKKEREREKRRETKHSLSSSYDVQDVVKRWWSTNRWCCCWPQMKS